MNLRNWKTDGKLFGSLLLGTHLRKLPRAGRTGVSPVWRLAFAAKPTPTRAGRPCSLGSSRSGFNFRRGALLLALAAHIVPGIASETSISVDAGKIEAPVNRLVFGHNLEAADGRGIYEPLHAPSYALDGIKYGQGTWDPIAQQPYPAVIEEVKGLGVGMLRYPGGCLAHNFDWRKAVGPLAQRGEWRFGIDEYIKLCRAWNVEPMITITAHALALEELPRHAADLVEYLNAPATPEHPWAMKRKEWGNPEPYGVKWFELGNEPDHGNHSVLPFRKLSAQDYVKYATSCIAAMRAVDPSIKIGAVTSPGETFDIPWNMAVYQEVAPLADFLVIHLYGPGVDGLKGDQAFLAAMAYSKRIEGVLIKFRKLCKEHSGKDLPLAITEWNISSIQNAPSTPFRTSYLAGLENADLTRLWLNPEYHVATTNFWHLLGGYWGLMRAADGSIVDRSAPVAFFKLLGSSFGDNLVATVVKGSPQYEGYPAPGIRTEGEELEPAKAAYEAALEYPYYMGAVTGSGMTSHSSGPGDLTVNLKDYHTINFLGFSKFSIPEAERKPGYNCFKLSFEARYVPAPGSAVNGSLGLGLCDERGWDATLSAMAIKGIEKSPNWTKFEGDFFNRPDSPGANLALRLEDIKQPLTGTLELRNIKVERSAEAKWPKVLYDGLTAISSLSQDATNLHVVVFNKSLDQPITAALQIEGFKANNAVASELYQPDVASTAYFEPTVSNVPLDGSGTLTRTFPPHSMTTLHFSTQPTTTKKADIADAD
jgi:alpha-N-arabinofuranosidase